MVLEPAATTSSTLNSILDGVAGSINQQDKAKS
jgi:hypothetical protein